MTLLHGAKAVEVRKERERYGGEKDITKKVQKYP